MTILGHAFEVALFLLLAFNVLTGISVTVNGIKYTLGLHFISKTENTIKGDK